MTKMQMYGLSAALGHSEVTVDMSKKIYDVFARSDQADNIGLIIK